MNHRIFAGTAPLIMGIVNLTPDSFADGGRYNTPVAAAARARELVTAGADILDIGAQSTRPGAVSLSAEEEWARLAPGLAAIRAAVTVPLSVDTFHREVAERALAAGADILNDISGSEHNGMMALAAKKGAALICMRPGDPSRRDIPADRVVAETAAFFAGAIARAKAAGLPLERLCLDVGIGFGSSPEGDGALIARLPEMLAGLPPVAVLVGASRKRAVADLSGQEVPPEERLPGTLALHTLALWQGARVLRVHDAAEAKQAALVTAAVKTQLKEDI